MLRPYEVVKWVEKSGEPLALARLKMRMIVHSKSSGFNLGDVAINTICSPEYMAALRTEAAVVVGKPLPIK